MLCIRNGILVLPGGVREADLYICGDKIFSVGGRWADSDVVDAAGCWVFPGFIGTKGAENAALTELSERALTGGYTTLPLCSSDSVRGKLCLDTCRLSAPETGTTPAGEDGFFSETDADNRPAALLRELSEQGSAGLLKAMRLLSEEPARALGLYPRKGAIRVGSDADITVWDPEYRYPLSEEDLTFSPGSPAPEPRRAPGRARSVFLRGQLVAGRGMVLRYAQGRWVSPD